MLLVRGAQPIIPPDLREKPRRPVNSDVRAQETMAQPTLGSSAALLTLVLAAGAAFAGGQQSSSNVARAPITDRATIGQIIAIDNRGFTANLGDWSCSFLVRENVANWNVSGGECRFIKFLNKPTHVKFVATNQRGEFTFRPLSLGKDIVRFVVENTTNGKQAVVSLHLTVESPEP